MEKFQKKRFLILLALALIGTGFFIYFMFFNQPKIFPEARPPKVKSQEDQIPPSTAVVSPKNNSWQKSDFQALIYDSDLGSGLDKCQYIIEDLAAGQATGDSRECGQAEIYVPAGEEKTCSSSYQKDDISQGKCRVSSLAFDGAGNSSGWQSRIFNTDFIAPKVGSLDSFSIGPGETKTFSAAVSDNSQISGCWFYVNDKTVNLIPDLQPIPCRDQVDCRVSLDYSFSEEGKYQVFFGCQDLAGNVAFGEKAEAKIVVNHDPKIAFCRVNPVDGDIDTQFSFNVGASDSDGDNLSFLWDFGDGWTSKEKSPVHQYQTSGTFEPKVKVSDGRGAESNCATAWAVVSKE